MPQGTVFGRIHGDSCTRTVYDPPWIAPQAVQRGICYRYRSRCPMDQRSVGSMGHCLERPGPGDPDRAFRAERPRAYRPERVPNPSAEPGLAHPGSAAGSSAERGTESALSSAPNAAPNAALGPALAPDLACGRPVVRRSYHRSPQTEPY